LIQFNNPEVLNILHHGCEDFRIPKRKEVRLIKICSKTCDDLRGEDPNISFMGEDDLNFGK
jgi:hypothetical protein